MGRLLDSNVVKKALDDAVDDISLGYYAVYGIRENDIEGIINSVPSAQTERKKGKWIRTRTIEHDGELYCSQCGQEHPEQKTLWNFCPNCGAKMEE